MKFFSSQPNKFSNNTIPTTFYYSVHKIGINLSALTLNGYNYDDINVIYSVSNYVKDTLRIIGTIKDTNGNNTKQGKIMCVRYDTTPNTDEFFQTLDHSIELSNGTIDTTTEFSYVNVDNNGNFTCDILLTASSVFYNYPYSSLQLIYYNDKNYVNTLFLIL